MIAHVESYRLTFEERSEYLYAKIKADTIDEDIARAYLREVEAQCARIKCGRLLLHRDIPAMLPDGVLYFVAEAFQEMTRGVKAAFVNPYEANQKSIDFAVTVGINRGGHYKTFTNDTDAEQWLLKGLSRRSIGRTPRSRPATPSMSA